MSKSIPDSKSAEFLAPKPCSAMYRRRNSNPTNGFNRPYAKIRSPKVRNWRGTSPNVPRNKNLRRTQPRPASPHWSNRPSNPLQEPPVCICHTRAVPFIPHPSSLIPHPSSFIPHPSSFIPHPSRVFQRSQTKRRGPCRADSSKDRGRGERIGDWRGQASQSFTMPSWPPVARRRPCSSKATATAMPRALRWTLREIG
jgi:hypothetical protein